MRRLVGVLALLIGTGAWAQGGAARKAEAAAKADAAAEKQDAAAKPPAGEVNWAGQVLKATGSGAPDMRATSPAQARLGAEMAAKMDAFRNLLSQARGVQIASGTTVGDAMDADAVRGRVEGVIRGYKVTAKRYYSDQGVELDVEVPLGAIVEAVVPVEDLQRPVDTKGPPTHTGVIVDATGLGVKPALAPRLVDAQGQEIYGASVVDAGSRKAQGVASFHGSVEEARQSERVGTRPLVLKASGARGTDLVLSADSLAKLKASNPSYLAQGRVAIVSQPASTERSPR